MVMKSARELLARLFLLVETLLTLPFFTVSWMFSAIGMAVLLGYRFAKIDDGVAKRKILRTALGEKGDE